MFFSAVFYFWISTVRDFDSLVRCFASDSTKQTQVFPLLHRLLTGKFDLTDDEKNSVKDVVFNHFNLLLRLNVSETVRLFLEFYSGELETIVNRLKTEPNLLLDLLKEILEQRFDKNFHFWPPGRSGEVWGGSKDLRKNFHYWPPPVGGGSLGTPESLE